MSIVSRVLSMGANSAVKAYKKRIEQIEAVYEGLSSATDQELRAMVDDLRARLSASPSTPGSKATWEDERLAYAILRERIRRHDGRVAHPVQLIGAMALYEGNIAQMATGEGKTIVAFFPAFHQALHNRQTHVLSVNEYLTQRDAEEAASIMGPLGVTVGRVYNQQPKSDKQAAYQCHVVYGTPSEFGFDYLRDNMVNQPQDRVQRGHDFAIIDEVDSILIDEARTPLIISGPGEEEDDTYVRFAHAVRGLRPALDEEHQDGDYYVEEDKRQIFATEQGLRTVEARLGYDDMYNAPNTPALVNHLLQALRAEYLFHRDKDYIVVGDEVKIVDDSTGRVMEGRRWSEGLHQAVEAKEGVTIRPENRTMATITLQNYFRMYRKLSGMTGTASTETAEFHSTYGLDVVAIPTNRPVARIDEDDVIFRTAEVKLAAIVQEVAARHATGQPVLVGTASIQSSERLSQLLSERGIPHQVLNAKEHAREAAIVAHAGRLGAVTIATNMAGRGTDIILGGSVDGLTNALLSYEFPLYGTMDAGAEGPGLPTKEDVARIRARAQAIHEHEHPLVMQAGGLCVIGSEHHDSRRVDDQLRGRAGRQGDPGYSRFYVSLEDDLMRLYGTDRMDRIDALLQRTHHPALAPIQAPSVKKAIQSTQRKVEEINAEARKGILEYDDVIDAQRKVIYAERNRIIDGEDLDVVLRDMIDEVARDAVAGFCSGSDHTEWDMDGLCSWFDDLTGQHDVQFLRELGEDTNATPQAVEAALAEAIHGTYAAKKQLIGNDEDFVAVERVAMLKVIDTNWVRHLTDMDYLRAGIGLRNIAQRDPLVEYRQEAYHAFGRLVDETYGEVLRMVLRMRVVIQED